MSPSVIIKSKITVCFLKDGQIEEEEHLRPSGSYELIKHSKRPRSDKKNLFKVLSRVLNLLSIFLIKKSLK